MNKHGTIDGSTEEVLAGMMEGGNIGGGIGFGIGVSIGGENYLNSLGGYCFIKGTLVLTCLGLSNIEDVRAGDYVYAKDEETGEQKYMPVLETYVREVNETYTVTIEGDSIETTANHPFYTVDEGWTNAEDLEAGDKVELSDGSSAEVESVEKNELEEPVTVYNFCVMDYNTYYVGEKGVYVHNCSPAPMADDVAEAAANAESGNSSGVTFKSQYEIPTNEKGYTKSSLDLGKKVHKEYMSDVADDVNKIKEYVLPSGKRVDFIDFENKIVYELKPNNPNQISKGTKQLAGYLEEIETVFGKGWSSVLDTY